MLEDAAREEAARLGVVGAQAALLRAGTVEEVAVGVAHAETGLAMTPDTLCQVGSTTKVLTAALVLQLCEEGLLDLDACAGDVVPGLPELVRPCTPRQLAFLKPDADGQPQYLSMGRTLRRQVA